jgi:hypothetical protein
VSGRWVPARWQGAHLAADDFRDPAAFPLQHLVAALHSGFVPGSTGIAWDDLGIIAAWGVAGLAIALRRFRWVPAAVKARPHHRQGDTECGAKVS